MKWYEYKKIGIGIGMDIDYINSFSDIVDRFSISESASETGFQSHNSVSGTGFRSWYLHWYWYRLIALPITWALRRKVGVDITYSNEKIIIFRNFLPNNNQPISHLSYVKSYFFFLHIKNVPRPMTHLSSEFGSGLDSGSLLGLEIGSGSVTATFRFG
jgi:hypothetical protein